MTDTALGYGDIHLSIAPTTGILAAQIGPMRLQGHCHAEISPEDRRKVTVTGTKIDYLARETFSSQFGTGGILTVLYTEGLRLEAALVEAALPFIALRLGLVNNTHEQIPVETLTPLTTTQMEFGIGPLDGWVNGFHSWSFSGFVPHTERQPRTTLGFLTWPLGNNPTTLPPRKRGQYIGEEVGALINGKRALVAGFIGVADQFGQIYMDGRPGHQSLTLQTTADSVTLHPGDTLWGEWAILYTVDLPHRDALGLYAETVTRLTPGRVPTVPPQPGWSSWYQFFSDVTVEDMARNQQALREQRDRLPLQVIQLDDGYQPAWGDWLDHNEKFPDGVAKWVESVQNDGYTAGLWLSPYTVDPRSRIFREQPDAILRDKLGRPIHGGFLIDRWIKGLDPTHPATQDFVRHVTETIVHQWGIRYLKLDFLYCGALPSKRFDPRRTRAQALRDGLHLIREVAGEDAVILGCGCPFGSAVGLVDIMRVSPDVAPNWYPKVFGLDWFRRDFSLPAARNSISISLHRRWTHRRWWWMDADNLLVREEQELTDAEVRSLVTVMGLTGSHLILGDDVPQVSKERMRWAERLLPLLEGEPDMSNFFVETFPGTLVSRMDGAAGAWVLAALLNWEDRSALRSIELADLGFPSDTHMIVCDFWMQRVCIEKSGIIHAGSVPPHGVALFGVRPVQQGPQYAGSDLHISIGSEVSQWTAASRELRFTISLGRKAEGTLWLKLPTMPTSATCDTRPVQISHTDEPGIFELHPVVNREAEIALRF